MKLKELKNNDVCWEVDGKDRGFGYKTGKGTYGLIRCPECRKENYAMNVSSGLCTWCPFNANNPTQDAKEVNK